MIILLHFSGITTDSNSLAQDIKGLFYKLFYFFGNKVQAQKWPMAANKLSHRSQVSQVLGNTWCAEMQPISLYSFKSFRIQHGFLLLFTIVIYWIEVMTVCIRNLNQMK